MVEHKTSFSTHQPLFPPGRIIHLVRQHYSSSQQQQTEGRSDAAAAQSEMKYHAILADTLDLGEVLVSPAMFRDHMPATVLFALQQVIISLCLFETINGINDKADLLLYIISFFNNSLTINRLLYYTGPQAAAADHWRHQSSNVSSKHRWESSRVVINQSWSPYRRPTVIVRIFFLFFFLFFWSLHNATVIIMHRTTRCIFAIVAAVLFNYCNNTLLYLDYIITDSNT